MKNMHIKVFLTILSALNLASLKALSVKNYVNMPMVVELFKDEACTQKISSDVNGISLPISLPNYTQSHHKGKWDAKKAKNKKVTDHKPGILSMSIAPSIFYIKVTPNKGQVSFLKNVSSTETVIIKGTIESGILINTQFFSDNKTSAMQVYKQLDYGQSASDDSQEQNAMQGGSVTNNSGVALYVYVYNGKTWGQPISIANGQTIAGSSLGSGYLYFADQSGSLSPVQTEEAFVNESVIITNANGSLVSSL